MEENVSSFLGKLTELVEQLKDTRTGDAKSEEHPGILRNAFDKSADQKKSDDNSNLAESIAEANAEQRKSEEETKGRRIMKTVMPMTISSLSPKAAKQLKDVLGSDKGSITGGKGPDVKESEGMFGWLLGLLPMLGTIGTVVMAVISGIGTVITTIFGIIAGPVGLVLLAVAAIAAFFVGFWEEWQESGDLGASFIAGFGKIFDWLIAFPATLLKDLATWALRKLGFDEEADFIDEHWDAFLAKWKEYFLMPITIVVGFFENLWDGISQIFDGFTDIFGGIGKLLTGDFEGAAVLFKSAFSKIINGFWDIIWALPNTIINWVFEFLGFKEEGDEDINLGDMLWDTMLAIFDWFKLLFTSPAEAFKKIGDWFDRLFDDPVGAFKELMPDWLVDFGVWVWDHTFGPIVDLWNRICGDPEGAKEDFLDLMPDWLRDIAGWIWDRTIGPAVDLWNKVFGHPDGAKAGFKALFPPWLWDIMEWIYDHTIGPVVGLFTDLFDGKDVEETFRKYLPDWMVDTFLWIKDNVFGGITEFFGKLFEGDVEGALRAILPDWLVDGLKWVVDNVFGPITEFWGHLFDGDVEEALRAILPDWLVDGLTWVVDEVFGPITDFFSTLFSGDIIGAFKKILPDWLLDFFGWLSDTLFAPVGKWFSDQWVKVTEMGAIVKKYLKREYPTVYDWFFGDEEEAALANKKKQEATQKALQGQGLDTATAESISDAVAAASANAGGHNYKDAVNAFTSDMWNIIEAGDSTDAQTFLDNLNAKGTGEGTASYAFHDYLKKSGIDTSNKQAVLEQAKWFSSQFEAGDWNDTVSDEGTARLQAAGYSYAELLKKDAQLQAAVGKGMEMFNTTGLPLGGENITNAMLKSLVITDAMQIQLKTMEADAKKKMAKWQGGNQSPPAEEILIRVFKKAGLYSMVSSAKNVKKAGNIDLSATEAPSTSMVNKKAAKGAPKKFNDFIMRPGHDPVAFNKGDILLGIHKDNPPGPTGGSPELISRVDQMVMTLKENKDIQAKMLEAMIESGMMKKQGNTVVNSGGNSTVVNNTTTQSSIMSFRDKVVGRISNSSTKY